MWLTVNFFPQIGVTHRNASQLNSFPVDVVMLEWLSALMAAKTIKQLKTLKMQVPHRRLLPLSNIFCGHDI